jgi:BirA family biotin operon repressor/biotin-[acetyl-CoA-carboxylase] ligase
MAEMGVEVSAVRGKGYRIYGGVDLLNTQRINQSLPDCHTHISLKTGSTNDDCRRLLAQGVSKIVMCSAELQSAGRGRRGKLWTSPFAKHLYVSVGLRLSLPLMHVSGITLAAGVVIARVLSALGVKEVAVKWPNDIWIGDAKVAGILTEVVGDAQGPCEVVIGLGLNVHPVSMKLDKQQNITFIREHGAQISRTELLILLARAFVTMRDTYEKLGLSAYLSGWQEYDLLRSKQVTISLHDQVIKAKCLGITAEGMLKIDAPPYELSSGEVSVRPNL